MKRLGQPLKYLPRLARTSDRVVFIAWVAATILGEAIETTLAEREKFLSFFLGKHSHLKIVATSSTCATATAFLHPGEALELKEGSNVVSREKLINLKKSPPEDAGWGRGLGYKWIVCRLREYWFHQGFGSGAGGPVWPE